MDREWTVTAACAGERAVGTEGLDMALPKGIMKSLDLTLPFDAYGYDEVARCLGVIGVVEKWTGE